MEQLKYASMDDATRIKKQLKFIFKLKWRWLKPIQLWIMRRLYYLRIFKLIDDELIGGIEEQFCKFAEFKDMGFGKTYKFKIR
jgi:hypothetical protein